MAGKAMGLGGIATAAAGALIINFLPAEARLLLFVSLLAMLFGICLSLAGAWQWYLRGRQPATVAWGRVAVSVALGCLLAVSLTPWMERAIIPLPGILAASTVGAGAMYAQGRHVGHSLLAGLIAACAFALALAAFWFMGAGA